MALRDLLTDPQSQPGSKILLGGEKRLKNSLDVFRRNAGAIIFNLQLDCLVANQLGRGRVDFQCSVERQRVDRIGNNIRNELLYLTRKTINRRTFLQRQVKPYLLLLQFRCIYSERLFNHCRNINQRRQG